MSPRQTIGQGPGNLDADTVTKRFKASEAMERGMIVAMDPGDETGYGIALCATGAGGLIAIPFGVTKEAIAAGEWGAVITGGFCDYLQTDGTVVAGSTLVARSGDAGYADTGSQDSFVDRQLGFALAADDGATLGSICPASIIINRLG